MSDNMFEVGDRVIFKAENLDLPRQAIYLNRRATVVDLSDEFIYVEFDDEPGKRRGGLLHERATLLREAYIVEGVEYLNVDEAIDAATLTAAKLGRPVEVKHA